MRADRYHRNLSGKGGYPEANNLKCKPIFMPSRNTDRGFPLEASFFFPRPDVYHRAPDRGNRSPCGGFLQNVEDPQIMDTTACLTGYAAGKPFSLILDGSVRTSTSDFECMPRC